MPSKIIDVKCSVCREVLKRRYHSVKSVIDRNGYYICKGCSLTIRNKGMAKKLWSQRDHKSRNRLQIKTRFGWRDLHVYMMESYLLRKLETGECVHHCDKDVFNNRISNLELMTVGAHTTLHHNGAKRSIETKNKIRNSAVGRISKNRTLTFETAERIRSDIKNKKHTYSQAADVYGTTKGIVANIIKNKTYKNKEN